MKPCVVGIGGAGGKILKQFLRSQDMDLKIHQFGEYLAFGDVKGVWLDSATHDAKADKFYGSLVEGCYPPYLICHDSVSEDSPTRKYVTETYGFDLKAMGFDRRAEYVKAIFEVFEFDTDLKPVCAKEFNDFSNPLSGYMWKAGIRPFTTIATSKSSRSVSGTEGKAQERKEERSSRISLNPGDLVKVVTFGSKKGPKFSNQCDSILFVASLGGGTGTGFINPITSFVRSEESSFFIFALGILTETGIDVKGTVEGQRYLGAAIAMYDLLTKESGLGIDGLLLMDNQILKEQFGDNRSAWDRMIYGSMKPLLDSKDYPGDEDQAEVRGIQRAFWEVEAENGLDKKDGSKETNLLPSMFVPCYNTQPDTVGDINTLVEGALGKVGSLYPLGKNDGRLFPCDPAKADRALVFTRGFFSEKEIAEAVASKTNLSFTQKEGKIEGKIKIYRKMGDSKNEDILILLRNPYGGKSGEHKRPGTLEWKLHNIIASAIDYIENNKTNILGFQNYKPTAKEKMENYFYGEKGLRWELYNCLDRIENGDRPIFRKSLNIFKDMTPMPDKPESCLVRPEILAGDKYDLRELVKSELKDILKSEDCRRRIKEILQS